MKWEAGDFLTCVCSAVCFRVSTPQRRPSFCWLETSWTARPIVSSPDNKERGWVQASHHITETHLYKFGQNKGFTRRRSVLIYIKNKFSYVLNNRTCRVCFLFFQLINYRRCESVSQFNFRTCELIQVFLADV